MMRNPDAKHLNFADLAEFIPENPKLLPSNVDMILERKGHFVIGEWKRPNEKISMGQQILLKAFANTPKFKVLIIIGDTDDGMYVEKIWQLSKDGNFSHIGNNAVDLKSWLRQWYEWID
jgi:hypothetical protein